MTHQLLARYDFPDHARFKAAFDADAEDRGNASLTVLQIWHEGQNTAWVLYQVANPARAREYVGGAEELFARQAGVTRAEFHWVETA
ncbi:hypothetical protein KTN05_02240 [Paracoccus sp. Z118]|uniref:hypothetical protein n=1 Tax=Paracoccus sp. Z118 TaxID=2851017 RepID=UPI001C2BAEEE|nr:hypothetical protein [Paracoccus sp. Z118]MBV0890669.1 hypothetical protein [Paracoccus sp. Z118]